MQDIVAIIMNGIPNTPMPATPRVSEEQAAMLVAYLRSLGESDDTSVSGNVAGEKHCMRAGVSVWIAI